MKIRKKFSLTVFFSISATIMAFTDVSSEVITAYGISAVAILGSFGAADVFGKKYED